MKPILFNTPMTRAILEGSKRVTRRLVKPQPEGAHRVIGYEEDTNEFELLCGNNGDGGIFLDWSEVVKAPYRIGDILYVRETWADVPSGYVYKANVEQPEIWHWRPSIHMPKEAARIFLLVTDVRVERLQEITEADAIHEGFFKGWRDKDGDMAPSARNAFATLWNTTLKGQDERNCCWAANPWVWVIEFERCEKSEERRVRLADGVLPQALYHAFKHFILRRVL